MTNVILKDFQMHFQGIIPSASLPPDSVLVCVPVLSRAVQSEPPQPLLGPSAGRDSSRECSGALD